MAVTIEDSYKNWCIEDLLIETDVCRVLSISEINSILETFYK